MSMIHRFLVEVESDTAPDTGTGPFDPFEYLQNRFAWGEQPGRIAAVTWQGSEAVLEGDPLSGSLHGMTIYRGEG